MSDFVDLVNHDVDSIFNDYPILRLWAYVIAGPYAPEGVDLTQWMQTAIVDDFYWKIFALESLPQEIEQVKTESNEKILSVWNESVKETWQRRYIETFMPALRIGVNEDCKRWRVDVPSWTGDDFTDYLLISDELIARKGHDTLYYVTNIDNTMLNFQSTDLEGQLQELLPKNSPKEYELLDKLYEEESVDWEIYWYERPIRMSDKEWVEEKMKRVNEYKKKEKETEAKKMDEEREEEQKVMEDNDRETTRAHDQKRL